MKIDEYKTSHANQAGHALVMHYVEDISKLFPVNYVEISPYTIRTAEKGAFVEKRRVIYEWCQNNLQHKFKLAYMNEFTALMCEDLEDAIFFKLRWC